MPAHSAFLQRINFSGSFHFSRILLLTLISVLVMGCTDLLKQDCCSCPIPPASDNQTFEQFLDRTKSQVLPASLQSASASDGYALLVGVEDANVSIAGFDQLKLPAKEVELMCRCLKNSGYRVKTLINEQATRDNIIQWLEKIAERKGKNRILFYYTGHGSIYGDQVKHNGKEVKGIYPHLDISWHQGANVQNIEKRLIEFTYGPIDWTKSLDGLNRKVVEKVTEEIYQRVYRSFFLIPYQPARGDDHGPFAKFRELVGYDELAKILARSTSTEKIVILDACSAVTPKAPIFNPLPTYNYDLQRQGFVFFTLISANEEMKISEGTFTPVIASGLFGAADRFGDGDETITTFELIRYANDYWDQVEKSWGIQPHQMNHMIFGSDDIPLTTAQKRGF